MRSVLTSRSTKTKYTNEEPCSYRQTALWEHNNTQNVHDMAYTYNKATLEHSLCNIAKLRAQPTARMDTAHTAPTN